VIFQHSCYRGYLRSVFTEKKAASPRYSLRAMAKQLDVSPSLLCEVQQGKKNLSLERALGIGKKLGLKAAGLDYFCTLVQRELAKAEETRTELSEKLSRLNPTRTKDLMNADAINDLTDWYIIPILALFDVANFSVSPKNIARKLGVGEFEANRALHLLEQKGLIGKDEKGKLVRTFDNANFESGRFHLGLRAFHRQMLQLAFRALEKQSPGERLTQTETLAIHPSDLPAARKIMKDACAEVVKLCDAHPKKSDVYHLHLQFFRLSKRGVK